MATLYSGGTPRCAAVRSSDSRCIFQNCTPSAMRLSFTNSVRYSHHSNTRSAGLVMRSMIFGCASAFASSARIALRSSESREETSSTKFEMSVRERSNLPAGGRTISGVAGFGGADGALGGAACVLASVCALTGVICAPIGASASAHSHAKCRNLENAKYLTAHELAVRVQRHEDTEACQQGHHRGPPVTDERQWHADHRQESGHHAGVDEHVHEECQSDAACEQARERILSLHRQEQ